MDATKDELPLGKYKIVKSYTNGTDLQVGDKVTVVEIHHELVNPDLYESSGPHNFILTKSGKIFMNCNIEVERIGK